MTTGLSKDAIAEAEKEYDLLRFELEKKYPNHYVAIEPFSKRYFIGYSLADAMRIAKTAMPHNEFFGIKIGSQATLRF